METHKKGLKDLGAMLKSFDEEGLEVEINSYTRTLCEIDRYGLSNGVLMLFEYKSTNSIKSREKALEQLERIAWYHHLIPVRERFDTILMFYCSGKNVQIEYVGRKDLNDDK